jgi:hypothetical protein
MSVTEFNVCKPMDVEHLSNISTFLWLSDRYKYTYGARITARGREARINEERVRFRRRLRFHGVAVTKTLCEVGEGSSGGSNRIGYYLIELVPV